MQQSPSGWRYAAAAHEQPAQVCERRFFPFRQYIIGTDYYCRVNSIRFLHAARHGGVHAMKAHIQELAGQHDNIKTMVYYETPRAEDIQGKDYDRAGRIDLTQVAADMLPADADYYLCGPLGFMLAQRDSLLDLGIERSRIHYEVFGSHTVAN